MIRFTAIALTILAIACTLGSVWWWALFGMSAEVGQAWALTCSIAYAGALIAVTAGSVR